jgi:Cd2+/Zn2+-exporting ATPase
VDAVTRRLHNPNAIPIASGVLIAAAAVLSFSAGVNPFSGGGGRSAAAAEVPAALVTSDALMVAGAVAAGLPIVGKAVRALAARVVAIDLLVSIAAVGALVIGELWEAAAVTFLFSVGHALETGAMSRTRSALAELVAVAPDVAVVLRGGRQVEVPAAQVTPGETVLVKGGAKVPVDGVVTGGTGALDEASITGESVPVEKAEGDQVFAGSISSGGFLQVRATGVGADTTLARIIHRVEEAQDARARTQTFLERFSAWYTPAIVVLSLAAGLVTGDVVLALTLLVIGCPGALVVSIPVAIVAGIGRGAMDGILVKGGEHLETSARIDAVALDKTGTLTEGKPHVTDVVVLDPRLGRADVLAWAARAEAGSGHPLARPVVDAAVADGLAVDGLPDHTDLVPGQGVVAMVDGRRVAVGNVRLLAGENITGDRGAGAEVDRLAGLGRTPMVVALDGHVIGVIAVADRLRAEARDMVVRLHDAGVARVVMLTGDTRRVAEGIASQVGVDEVRAQLLPEDKLDAITRLQGEGWRVAMVGDGVNDAPALAAADVGVAMGAAGAAVAIETADIALMNDDLLKLPQAIDLARRTVAVVRQNITIALLTVVALLIGVFAGGVTMAIGMLLHEASVLVVILNATRLLRRRDHTRRTGDETRTAGTGLPTPQAQPA